MRLIDADELRQRFIKRIQPLIGKDNSNERHEYMSWLRSVHLLDDMPTVDIVRCKDCDSWDEEIYLNRDIPEEARKIYGYEEDRNCCMCLKTGLYRNADDFCSRGERK